MTCLAAILIMVAYNMSGFKTFGRMIKTAPKSDILVLITTLLLTVFFDLVVANRDRYGHGSIPVHEANV